MYFLLILAVALFAIGMIYINEHVVTADARVGFTICLLTVVGALFLIAALKTSP